MSKDERAFYRVPEVAEMFGVTPAAVHYWISQGYLQTAGRFGASPKSPIRIAHSEVERIRTLKHDS